MPAEILIQAGVHSRLFDGLWSFQVYIMDISWLFDPGQTLYMSMHFIALCSLTLPCLTAYCVHDMSMIQAVYQALHIGDSLGTCNRCIKRKPCTYALVQSCVLWLLATVLEASSKSQHFCCPDSTCLLPNRAAAYHGHFYMNSRCVIHLFAG